MRTLDVHPIIDNARFTPFHWMVMAWCGLLLIFDGYDLFIYGVVLPVIMKEWGLTRCRLVHWAAMRCSA